MSTEEVSIEYLMPWSGDCKQYKSEQSCKVQLFRLLEVTVTLVHINSIHNKN